MRSMVLLLLRWLGMFLALGLYLGGVAQWAYLGRWRAGALAVLLAFPALLLLSQGNSGVWLRAAPLLGVLMFLHHLRGAFLRSISLLWYTTLTVLVSQGYYAWVLFRH